MKIIRKYLLRLLLIINMIITVFPVQVHAEQGTAAYDHDLYLLEKIEHKKSVPSGYTGIYTVDDLKALNGTDRTKNIILMNDLDLSGEAWTPIKFKSNDYTGTFDGNGYTINFGADTNDHIALFEGNEGTIKNLRISGEIHITSNLIGHRTAASVVLENEGNIYNCTSSVDFISDEGTEIVMGGIAVYNSGTISHCRYTGSMRTTNKAYASFGGIAYENQYKYINYVGSKYGLIDCCESNSNMTVLLGKQDEMTYEVADIIELRIGGIAGESSVGTSMTTCRFTGNINITGEFNQGYIFAGGICGKNDGSELLFNNCSFTGKIKFNCTYKKYEPSFAVGGLFGQGGSDTLNHCFVSGEMLNDGMVLGTPGWFYGSCMNYMENRGTYNYYPAGSLNLCGDKEEDGFDTGFTAVPVSTMSQKGTFAGFDFNNVWTMGQSYPIQKVFTQLYGDDETPDPTPTPDPDDDTEIDAEEYILEHLEFIHSNVYETRSQLRFSKVIEDCLNSPDQQTAETAYKILNTINETIKFKKWSIFENQYEEVIAELITSCAMEETDTLEMKLESPSLDIANNLWDLLKNCYPGEFEDPEYETSLQKLLKTPEGLEEENPGLYKALVSAIEGYFVDGQDKANAIKAISGTTALFGKMNDFIDYFNDCASVVEWLSELHSFQCTVEALHSLTQDQLNIFRSLDDYIKETAGDKEAILYRTAYQKFDNYLTKENIAATVFEEGITSFGDLTLSILSPFISAVMTSYLIDVLGISTELAGDIAILIAGFKAGWGIGTALTNNDKIMAGFDLLHANAKIEEALYQMTLERASALDSQKTYQSAVNFDVAWMLLRGSEKYAVSEYKEILEDMQDSIKSKFLTFGRVDIYGNAKTDEISFADYEYIKWDNAICHGQKMYDRISGSNSQFNTVSLSGIKSFTITDINGELLLDVFGGDIFPNTPSIIINQNNDNYSIMLGGDMDIVMEIYDMDDDANIEVTTANENGVIISQEAIGHDDFAKMDRVNIYQYEDEQAYFDEYSYHNEDDDWLINVDPEVCYIAAGDTITLEAIIDPSIEGTEITWTTDDPDIATVDQKGKVKAIKPGSTFINAEAVDEDYFGYCYVNVLFQDVTNQDLSYFDPVYWALEAGITTGTSPVKFSPGNKCLRYHFVLFLWRQAGKPEPKSKTCPFKDVKKTDSFYKAVLWAYENKITTGTDATHFSPYKDLTRGQVCTFLYRKAGSPYVSTNIPFVDVPSNVYYTNAVKWAALKGITTGTDPTHFKPETVCTRAQTVTFLYRMYFLE